MKSIKRGERLTILLIVLFLLGMVLLVARIVSQATFYMSHSHNVKLGYIYDRNGAVLFDENATAEKYGADYFLDVGNLIGDNSGRMTNTLVSENLKDLQNYHPRPRCKPTGLSVVRREKRNCHRLQLPDRRNSRLCQQAQRQHFK